MKIKDDLQFQLEDVVDIQEQRSTDIDSVMEPMDTSESPPSTTAKPTFVQRRRHMKSRNGCLECKKRKVKCDENREANSCGACLRRGTQCSFRLPTPPLSLRPTPDLQRSSDPVSNLLDLEILHNYSTKTSITITGHREMQVFQRTVFVDEALKCTYTLHCLLGLSAFHLVAQYHELIKDAAPLEVPALRAKLDQYLVAASFHHNAGLSGFRHDIVNISQQNCHSLVLASTLIAIISFAESCDGVRLSSEAADDAQPTITRWHILLRGVKTVLEGSWQWLQDGPMGAFPSVLGPRTLEDCDSDIAAIDGDVTLYLDRLCFTFTGHSELEVSRICIAAIKSLRKAWTGIASGLDIGIAFFWPVLVDDEFMKLLEKKTSEALLVFGAYCVLIHSVEWYWWIQGWPRNMLRMIEGLVEEEWRSWLDWSISMVDDEDKVRLRDGLLVVTEGQCCGST